MNHVIITTADLKRDYEIIGPLYFHISNKGFFTSRLANLITKYEKELKDWKNQGKDPTSWNYLYGNYAMEIDSRFEKAFYIAVREVQEVAHKMRANAVVGLRQDVKLDANDSQYFYLELYGTAVRYTNTD